MTATHGLDSISSNSQLLYVALELGEGQWKLASSNARGLQARLVSIPVRLGRRLQRASIKDRRRRLGIPIGEKSNDRPQIMLDLLEDAGLHPCPLVGGLRSKAEDHLAGIATDSPS